MVFSDKQISILSNYLGCLGCSTYALLRNQRVHTIFLNFIDEIDPRTDKNLLVRPQKIPGTQ